MSSKLLGAFRESLKVGEEQPVDEAVKDEAPSDQPRATDTAAATAPRQVRQAKKQRRYSLAPY